MCFLKAAGNVVCFGVLFGAELVLVSVERSGFVLKSLNSIRVLVLRLLLFPSGHGRACAAEASGSLSSK